MGSKNSRTSRQCGWAQRRVRRTLPPHLWGGGRCPKGTDRWGESLTVSDSKRSGRLFPGCGQVLSSQHRVAVFQGLLRIEAKAARLFGQHLQRTFQLDERTEHERI